MAKMLATVMMLKLIKMNKEQQLRFIKKNLKSKEFMELIYLGYHTSIDFRFKLLESKPRPQLPKDFHKEFFRLAMTSVKDQFNEGKRETLQSFIATTDPLSQYIYSKIINKSLGLSRNDLEINIPGLIVKEPYEIISSFGAPKLPCIIQTYNKGTEAIVTITSSVSLLKDKGGVAVSGFDKHIDAIKSLGLKGTFNVVISGENEGIFMEHVVGKNERYAEDLPLTIIDYNIDTELSGRLLEVEVALIERPQVLVQLAESYWIKDLSEFREDSRKDLAVARQDIKPLLWEAGTHSIDVSFLI